MKGLQHSVIEIKDTDNEEIERILVFLKPGGHKIDVNNTRQEAQDILQKVRVRKTMPKFRINSSVAIAIGLAVFIVVLSFLMLV